MKINLVSDLHLQFGGLTLPGGDVLILAGDIFEAVTFIKKDTKPQTNAIFQTFIEKELAKYHTVLYVMGNHEHYGGVFQNTKNILRAHLPDNTHLLENKAYQLEDIVFFGTTMWTDFNRGEIYAQQYAQLRMNDFHYIRYDRFENGRLIALPKMSPKNTIEQHDLAKLSMEAVVDSYGHKKIVMITHHAPTFQSIDSKYDNDTLNFAYVSDLSKFILDNPNIKTWVHGHIHNNKDYIVGDTRVICNPRGYRDENKWGFDPKFTFEV